MAEVGEATGQTGDPAQPARSDWTVSSVYALLFLTFISTLNYFDRFVISLVMPLVQAEMGFNDAMVGIISSVVTIYAVVGLPVAMIADRWNRRNIIAIGFFFWSAMTALTGFAANVTHLIVTRFLMAVGESCGVAPSNAMLSDIFSKQNLTKAIAIFTCASSVAAIVYSPAAGWLADTYGWRLVFLLAGVPGMILALVFFLTVKEPPRGAAEGRADTGKAGIVETFRFLAGSPAFWCLIGGSALLGGYLYGMSTFTSIFLVRVHGFDITFIGAVASPIRGIVSAAGILIGGWIASRLSVKNERWRCYLPALACLLLLPSEILFIFADPFWLWMAGLVTTSLFSIMNQPAVYAALMAVAKPRMRTTAVSVNLLGATFIGQIIGSIIVGAVSDALKPAYGDLAIRYSLVILLFCIVAGGISFYLGAFFIERDIKRAQS